MKYKETKFEGLITCIPSVYKDERGYFYESFRERDFQGFCGKDIRFAQDNQSMSGYGVIRGLHMQVGEYAQAKLIRCVQGAVWDVAVDMRRDKRTFGKYFAVELSAENHVQLFIPEGFAHGFAALTDRAVVAYKCSNYYHKESEIGIAYDDPQLHIDWKIPPEARHLSQKDRNNLSFAEASKLIS